MSMSRLKREVSDWLAVRDIPPKDRAAVGEAVGTWIDENVQPRGGAEQRKALLVERRKLSAQLEKTLVRVQAHTSKLKAAKDEAWEAFAQAAMAHTQAEASMRGELSTYTRQIDLLERELTAGAPACIDQFLDSMRREMFRLWGTRSRTSGTVEEGEVVPGPGFWAQLRSERVLYTDEADVVKHKQTVMTVCERAVELKATALTDADAEPVLAGLSREVEAVAHHKMQRIA